MNVLIHMLIWLDSKFHAICIYQNFKNWEKRGQVSDFYRQRWLKLKRLTVPNIAEDVVDVEELGL